MSNSCEPPGAPIEGVCAPEAIDTVQIYKQRVLPAFVILSGVYAASAAFEVWAGDSRGFLYEICALVGMFLTNGGILYLLDEMSNRVTTSGVVRYFTIWGFVWRALSTVFIASICTVLMVLAIGISPATNKDSAFFALFSTIPMLLASVIVIWALFSNNRRLQVLWISRLLGRG